MMFGTRVAVLAALLLMLIFSACSSSESTEMNPTVVPTKIPATFTPEPTPTQKQVEVFESISYADQSPFQKLDVYLPSAGEKPYPTIMGIHGGGFVARSKSLYGLLARYYAEEGFAFVSINYRLAPQDTYPAQVEDSFCALGWLYANQDEFGFDPDRVIVTGGSAGGYLASMLATVDNPQQYLKDCPHDFPTDSQIDAAVIFYGLYDLASMDEYPGVSEQLEPYLGDEYENVPVELLEEMSPIKQIDGSEPPFIILHGTDDNSIPAAMSERFYEELIASGVDAELVILPGAGHGFEITSLEEGEMALALGEIFTFLNRVLGQSQ
jgi:acetyl esterase/lipase